jgi:hypothetical protein
LLGCICHGGLFVFGAPHKHRLLLGREHGRTIPLSDLRTLTLMPDATASVESASGD